MKVEGNIEYPVMTVCEAYDADIRNKTRRAEKNTLESEQGKHNMGERQAPHSCADTSPIKEPLTHQ